MTTKKIPADKKPPFLFREYVYKTIVMALSTLVLGGVASVMHELKTIEMAQAAQVPIDKAQDDKIATISQDVKNNCDKQTKDHDDLIAVEAVLPKVFRISSVKELQNFKK